MNINADAVSNLGSMLKGSDATAYQAFADSVAGSKVFATKVFGTNEKKLLGTEVSNVLSALAQVGEHLGAELIKAIASSEILKIPAGINGSLTSRTSGTGPRASVYYTYKINQKINVCKDANGNITGLPASCEVSVVMDLELASIGQGGPTGNGTSKFIQFPALQLNVTTLTASNSYVSVAVPAGNQLLNIGLLYAQVEQDADDKLTGALAIVEEVVANNLTLQIRDAQSVAVLEAKLTGGWNSLEVNVDMAAEDTTLELINLADVDLGASLSLKNGSGDELKGNLSAGAAIVGEGPFTYVFAKELEKVGEDAANFLGVNAEVNYSAVVGGSTLFSNTVKGGRASNESLSLDSFKVQHGGLTYELAGEFSEKGEILALTAVDPVSGVKIEISTTGGVTSGRVTSATGTQLGTVAKNASGKLEITYTDGSTQLL